MTLLIAALFVLIMLGQAYIWCLAILFLWSLVLVARADSCDCEAPEALLKPARLELLFFAAVLSSTLIWSIVDLLATQAA